MKFEEGIQKLAEITAKLETGGLPLEDAVRLYSEGAALADACKQELEAARLTVSQYGQNQNAASAAEQNEK